MSWLRPNENFTDSPPRLRTARDRAVTDGMALPIDWSHSEAEVCAGAAQFLRPFCSLLIPEYKFQNGLRADFGFRLKGAGSYLLTLEAKRFTPHSIAPLVAAIRQAHSYSLQSNFVSLVGPLYSDARELQSWHGGSVLGAVNLLAGQFSVGFFCIGHGWSDQVGAIVVGNQVAVRFQRDGTLKFHANYDRLLLHKHGHGSNSWRESA